MQELVEKLKEKKPSENIALHFSRLCKRDLLSMCLTHFLESSFIEFILLFS